MSWLTNGWLKASWVQEDRRPKFQPLVGQMEAERRKYEFRIRHNSYTYMYVMNQTIIMIKTC